MEGDDSTPYRGIELHEFSAGIKRVNVCRITVRQEFTAILAKL